LADAATITEFQLAMAWETEQLRLDPLKCTPGVRAVFEQPQRGRYYVAQEGNRVLGSLLITYEWSDWRNGDIWWIQSVYVIPEARGRGVFKQLFHHVKSLTEARNDVCGLRLYVEKRNTRAKQVYLQLGMSGDHYEVCEWMKGP
jgi:GNAT superfamily N-acetyltransferase